LGKAKSKGIKSRRTGEKRAVWEWVRVVSRGPKKCALCGRQIGKTDDKVMLGSNSSYAHMRCGIRYSFRLTGWVEEAGEAKG
jgi:hypothetical protein